MSPDVPAAPPLSQPLSQPQPPQQQQQQQQRRARCARCDRPWPRGCLCGFVRPVANRVDVLLLQHPDEVDEAKGSARLMALSLARCRVVVGEVFEPAALAAWLHAGGARALLLYPEVEAAPATSLVAPPAGGDRDAEDLRLVVIDATWRKSLRMLLSNPALGALPRLALAPPDPGAGVDRGYGRLRTAHRAGQRSTLEATCAALAALEGEAARYAPVLDAFDDFVARSLRARAGG